LTTLVEAVANYPCAAPAELLEQLGQLGVQLVELGDTVIHGFRVLGKGTRGIVVAGLHSGRIVAVKFRRCDSPRPSLTREAEMLSLANTVGVGPKLLYASHTILVMEYVDGVPLRKHWLIDDARLAACVADSLAQARKLDTLGLDHGELSRAHAHVYSTPRGATIIDFDSASTGRKAHNYNSLYSYYFRARGQLQDRLRAILPRYLRSQVDSPTK
jgi:putative serine/threonine protein kinase